MDASQAATRLDGAGVAAAAWQLEATRREPAQSWMEPLLHHSSSSSSSNMSIQTNQEGRKGNSRCLQPTHRHAAALQDVGKAAAGGHDWVLLWVHVEQVHREGGCHKLHQ